MKIIGDKNNMNMCCMVTGQSYMHNYTGVCNLALLTTSLEFTAEFMMALVTHTHWVTEASVQEREPLAGAQATVHTPTLSAVVLWVLGGGGERG